MPWSVLVWSCSICPSLVSSALVTVADLFHLFPIVMASACTLHFVALVWGSSTDFSSASPGMSCGNKSYTTSSAPSVSAACDVAPCLLTVSANLEEGLGTVSSGLLPAVVSELSSACTAAVAVDCGLDCVSLST